MTGVKLPLGSGMGCSGGTGTVIVGDQGSGEWSFTINVSSKIWSAGCTKSRKEMGAELVQIASQGVNNGIGSNLTPIGVAGN